MGILERIKLLRSQGWSSGAIGDEVGYTGSRIRQLLEQNQADLPEGFRERGLPSGVADKKLRALELMKECDSCAEIARRMQSEGFDISDKMVQYYKRTRGG